jgi:hypothetical protein
MVERVFRSPVPERCFGANLRGGGSWVIFPISVGGARSGAEGAAGAGSRSAWWRDLLLQGAQGRSDQGAVARRGRQVAVSEAPRGGEVHLAGEPERGGCAGLGGAARLSSGVSGRTPQVREGPRTSTGAIRAGHSGLPRRGDSQKPLFCRTFFHTRGKFPVSRRPLRRSMSCVRPLPRPRLALPPRRTNWRRPVPPFRPPTR